MKGIYFLIISIKNDKKISIGSLDNILFNEGVYIYVGSGMNNVKKRVERHLSDDKKIHWHIDYLLKEKNIEVNDYHIFSTEDKSRECELASNVNEYGEEINGFGSSDCKCSSHLIRINDEVIIDDMVKDLIASIN